MAMRQGDQQARAGPNEKGRPHHRAAPSSIAALDHNQHPEKFNDRVILITESDPGVFVVEVDGEGRREFRSHRAAYGFASGQRMIIGLPIVDRAGGAHE